MQLRRRYRRQILLAIDKEFKRNDRRLVPQKSSEHRVFLWFQG